MDVSGVNQVPPYSSGRPGDSQNTIMTVGEQIALDIGNYVRFGTTPSQSDITNLINLLNSVPKSDPNYQIAQQMIVSIRESMSSGSFNVMPYFHALNEASPVLKADQNEVNWNYPGQLGYGYTAMLQYLLQHNPHDTGDIKEAIQNGSFWLQGALPYFNSPQIRDAISLLNKIEEDVNNHDPSAALNDAEQAMSQLDQIYS